MIPINAVKNEEFNYFLHILKNNDDDLKATVIELNEYHHYQFVDINDFIDKFYEVKQFIDNQCLYNAQKYFERELMTIDETYRNRVEQDC